MKISLILDSTVRVPRRGRVGNEGEGMRRGRDATEDEKEMVAPLVLEIEILERKGKEAIFLP